MAGAQVKGRIAIQFTDRERDALLTLDACPAAWPTFDRRTWQSLVNKRVVRLTPKPVLTHAGVLLVSFTRALGSFTSESESPPSMRSPSAPPRNARASKPLGIFAESAAGPVIKELGRK